MIDSFKWSVIGSSVNKLISIIVFILMAQKLPPSDFGIVAIVSIILGFGKIFTEAGYKEAIIYYKITDSLKLSSIFWLLMIISFLFFILLNIFKSYISNFFNGGLEDTIFYMSFLLLLTPIQVVSSALLERNMKFKKLAIAEFVSLAVSSILGILLVHNNYSIMSLVYMLIANQLALAILLYLSVDFWIGLRCSFSKIKYISSYSIHLISFTLVNYIVENLDKLLISKFMGKFDVGIYQRTQEITMTPSIFISRAIGRVAFPYMASFKDDLKRVKQLHVDLLFYILLFGVPFISLFIIFSNEFVLILLGSQWKGMIPLLEIFAIMGIFQIIGFISVNVYKSLGRVKLQNKVNILLKVIVLISIFIGINFGIVGLAYSLLIARIVTFIITQYFVCNLVRLNLSILLARIFPVALYATVFILSFSYFGKITIINNIFDLFLNSILFISLYFALAFLFFRVDFLDVRKKIEENF
jgi:O-antigen/teichoic acid export membrane protein